jgi:hypothetical protein
VWFAGNVVFRSEDRGENWTTASPDLTRGQPGPNDYRGHTITTLAESPLTKGLVYAGTDDGNVWCSHDGGRRWQDLTDKLVNTPRDRWITRVEPSRHEDGVVYLSFDRHRNDDRAPYLFKSADFGHTWRPLAASLPTGGPVHVVREDPHSPDLLFVGTEFGLFVSLDGGGVWHKQAHLPSVAVHDLAVHPRERELVIATHGRGIYIMDVAPLEQLTREARSRPIHLCDIRPAQAYRQTALSSLGIKHYAGANPPYGAVLHVYVRDGDASPAVSVTDVRGKIVAELKGANTPGLQRLIWNLNKPGTKKDEYDPVPSGEYTATLRVGERAVQKRFSVQAEE